MCKTIDGFNKYPPCCSVSRSFPMLCIRGTTEININNKGEFRLKLAKKVIRKKKIKALKDQKIKRSKDQKIKRSLIKPNISD